MTSGIVLSGLEAAVRAVEESGVKIATGVPGYPINGLFTALQASKAIDARWQFNEKIAFEIALGASASGERAMVVTKHVGMNVLADPLIISATHGIGAGLVVIAGDDVGATMSHNEQDSRWYGKLAEIPVYDPSTPGELYDAILDGLRLSERISAPVLIRIVEPVLTDTGKVLIKSPIIDSKRIDRSVWDLTMYGKHQRYLSQGWSVARFESTASKMNKASRRNPIAIISSGYATLKASRVAESLRLSHLALGFINPFPRDMVIEFMRDNDFVLVCEEPGTFIEEHINGPKSRGRLTGHLPAAGPLDEGDIINGVRNIAFPYVETEVEPEKIESRGVKRTVCAGCPFTPVYDAIKKLGAPVAGDAGCSILTANAPYKMVDVACSLGSAVSVACGMKPKGVAMMGDFAVLHTGMQALLNAKLQSYDVLAVIFDNGTAAMTGGQKIPDISGILKDVFKDDCTVVDMEGLSAGKAYEDLKGLYDAGSMKVYVVKGTCVMK